ncbi:MAG: hypothetical protein N2Z23_11175 [Pyrinomonadaceae bacterium]|nr:hypothetical protein [Pyrinomonadaceae bacterium]MCX7640987.1 hypothetical protein [Pyrinomonadaceae bacterium]MDW8305089.1 DUF6677 family protein [Acidobacteriota bacterium]
MQKGYVFMFFQWFLPGVGYFLAGKRARGFLVGFSIWLMFAVGVLSGGLGYREFSKESFLLYYLNLFASFGNGLGWFISLFLGEGRLEDAARITYEYGGRLIEIAGLLNYMAVLDVFDICSGRKK